MHEAVFLRAADDPLRNRSALLVVGEILLEGFGVELDEAARRRKLVVLGILVELAHARRKVLPILLHPGNPITLFLPFLVGNLGRHDGCVKRTAPVLFDSAAVGHVLFHAELLRDLNGYLVVAKRLAAFSNCIVAAMDDGLRVLARPGEVGLLNAYAYRKHQVGEDRIVLEPLVVGDEAFNLRAAIRLLEQEPAVPACLVARLLGPDHMEFAARFDVLILGLGVRVPIFVKLVLGRAERDLRRSPPLGLPIEDGFVHERARNSVLVWHKLLSMPRCPVE